MTSAYATVSREQLADATAQTDMVQRLPQIPMINRETGKRAFLMSGLVTRLCSKLIREELDHGAIEALVKHGPVEPRPAFADLRH